MTNGVSNIMDEYQTLYDNYVKERTDQQNKIKAQMEQLDAPRPPQIIHYS